MGEVLATGRQPEMGVSASSIGELIAPPSPGTSGGGYIVHNVNSSNAERFELAYRRIWSALNRPDDPDLSQHERQLLHHIPRTGGVSLNWLAHHLALPKSSASVLVKDLHRRGFVTRTRDRGDERRLSIVLTAKGRRRVMADRVLDPRRLGQSLDELPHTTRGALLRGMEQLADVAARKYTGATEVEMSR
jgi:DNA-binding MarR family transcriptional regulator